MFNESGTLRAGRKAWPTVSSRGRVWRCRLLNLLVEVGIVVITALIAYAIMHATARTPQRLFVLLLYFSFTLFVSATLLFLVQPMIGKLILPQLGGTPAVWNTCMVFFQGVLLVGYGYTH